VTLHAPRLAKESIQGRRPYQEDSFYLGTLTDGRTLVAVADGMGGHAAGEVASALAIEELVGALNAGEDLQAAFVRANSSVHAKAQEPGKLGMGTTLVAALVEGDSFRLANIGDSRCYLVSAEAIRQLSHDHSFAAEALERGQTHEEVLASHWKDALTRSVGTDPEVEVDVFGPFPVEAATALLLCSDGLYKSLSDDRLHQLFLASSGPRGATRGLVTGSFEAGSDDNITCVIAEFGEVPRDRPMGTMPIEFEPPEEEDVSPAVSGGGEEQAAAPPERDGVAPVDEGEEPAKKGWLGKLWPRK
jgi:PPM family protein phosphatase